MNTTSTNATTEHPSLIRLRARLASFGSTAKTPRGVRNAYRDAARYAIHRDRLGVPRPIPQLPTPPMPEPSAAQSYLDAREIARERATSTKARAAEYRAQEAKRKADPEAKRARNKSTFRRAYLARLRRRERRALELPTTTLAETITSIDRLPTAAAELLECARLRAIATGKQQVAPTPTPTATQIRLRANAALVPISAYAARIADAPVNMRGANATIEPTSRKTYGEHSAGETEWKGTKPVKYHRATHRNYVRSIAQIRPGTDARTLDYICHETAHEITLSGNYHWELDAEHQVRAVETGRRSNEYHPESFELQHSDAAARIVAALQHNADRRDKLRAQEVADRAAMLGVFVCLADSLRAGNCAVGTRNFAERHGLDTRKHYAAPEFLDMANGDSARVRLAITAAVIRHKREERDGLCQLAEHRAD